MTTFIKQTMKIIKFLQNHLYKLLTYLKIVTGIDIVGVHIYAYISKLFCIHVGFTCFQLPCKQTTITSAYFSLVKFSLVYWIP